MKLHPCLTGKSRIKVSKNVLKTVSRVLKKMQPSMYEGQRGFTCDETYLEEIVQTIRARKGVSSANCINFLSKLVDYSKRELDWGVPPIPREPLPLFHKNNCSLESFEDYLCLENVLKDFYSELESPIPDSADDRIWQILLSAISHDSILEKRWLKPLLKALSKGINLSGSWLWLELEGEKRCTSENLHSWHARKRWIADPLTHFLITRWIDKFPEDRKALKNFDILGAIKKCRHLQKHRRIRTVGGLLKLAKARAYYVLPDFLVDYASGSLPAVCVDKYTWARIMDDKRVHYPEQRMQADLQPVDAAILKRPPVVSGEFDPDIQIELFKELLRKKFWEKIKKEGTEEEHVTSPEEARVILKSFLDKNRGDLSQTFILLVKWARQLLSDKKHIFEQRRKSKPLKVSSVKTYLHNIGDGLLNCASNIDLLKLKDLKREKVYGDAILYKKTYGSRFHAAEQLEQFHGFLWVFYRRISANFDSIRIEVDLPPINVNAFIITPVEYKKILKLLGWEQQLLNIWQKMRIVATILGCKTDLRQSEIVSIRLVEFQDGAEPYIQYETMSSTISKQKILLDKYRSPPFSMMTNFNSSRIFMRFGRAKRN